MACSSNNTGDSSSFSKGALVEVSSDADGFRGVWYEAKILKKNGRKAFLVQYLTLLSEDGSEPLVEKVNSAFVRPLPPVENDLYVFDVNDVVDAFCLDGWWVGVVAKVLNLDSNTENYLVLFENPPDLLELKRSDLRTHWDWLDGKWVRPKKKKVLNAAERKQHVICSHGCAENLEESIAFENSCAVGENALLIANCSTKVQMEQSTPSTENSALCAVTSTGKEMKQASPAVDASLISHTFKKLKGVSADAALFLKACPLRSIPSELALSSSATSSLEKTKRSKQRVVQKEVRNVSQKKRKREMLPKSLVKGKEWSTAGGAVDEMVVKDCEIIDVELLKDTRELTGSGNVSTETAAELSDTGCSSRQVEMPIVKTLSNVASVDKPITISFDGLCLPTVVVDSRFINSVTVNQGNETVGRLVQFPKQHSIKESTSNTNPKENLSLPFVKHSSVLKVIESMEVFQKMPQKPHFHLLDKSNKMYLEGLAIGYMITFANVVEQTSKLQVNDPRSAFNSIFEALLDLESHGFDVRAVRRRLTELQAIKERQELCQEQLEDCESQILEKTDEQTKIMVEFDDIVKQIKVLEERKTKLISVKEKNESEIAKLKSKVDVVNEDIQNARLDFESVAVSPW